MPKTTIDDAIRILSERPYLPHPWILFLESARDRNLPQYYLSRLRTYKDVPAEIVTDEYSPDYDRAKGRRTHILHISLTIQKMVDEGHQPWRFDPEYYAKHFMNSYYPNLDPNEREKLPASLELKGHSAIVKIVYEGKEHVVYLQKAFPSNPESIWIVEKMAIRWVSSADT